MKIRLLTSICGPSIDLTYGARTDRFTRDEALRLILTDQAEPDGEEAHEALAALRAVGEVAAASLAISIFAQSGGQTAEALAHVEPVENAAEGPAEPAAAVAAEATSVADVAQQTAPADTALPTEVAQAEPVTYVDGAPFADLKPAEPTTGEQSTSEAAPSAQAAKPSSPAAPRATRGKVKA